MDFPVMHDALNLVGTRVVPLVVGLDEFGVVRVVQPRPDTIEKAFLNKKFSGEQTPLASDVHELPDPRVTRRYAHEARLAPAFCRHGDALVLAGLPIQIDEAIDIYQEAINLDAKMAEAYFRRGVAFRARFDGPGRKAGDFQEAIDAWAAALKRDPNHYIYRRRLQQYGPRLDKPYPFYDWVETARKAIRDRGDEPVSLVCEPIGAELAAPDSKPKHFKPAPGDPEGKITRDDAPLILLEHAVVRSTQRTKQDAYEVHLTFRPNAERAGHWNNEADPLRVWVRKIAGAKAAPRYIEYPGPSNAAVSEELRTVSLEVRPTRAAKKTLRIEGYALYNVCEGQEGKCLFRRKDFDFEIKLQR